MMRPDWTVSVPDGRSGPWAVESFEISPAEARMHNVRCAINSHRGGHLESVEPGAYKRLRHDRRGIVMSNTPFEQRTNMRAWSEATGRVLINGLGLGMLLGAILRRPDVEYVRVIEIDPDVIRLVWPAFEGFAGRAEIVHADALAYQPAKGERFDFAWHDIWDDVCGDNVPQITALKRKYSRRAAAQLAWGEWQMRDAAKRDRAFISYATAGRH